MATAHDVEAAVQIGILRGIVADLEGEVKALRGELRILQDAKVHADAVSAAASAATTSRRGSIAWWLATIGGFGGLGAMMYRLAEWVHIVPATPKVP